MSKYKTPLVSIITPAYNQADYLGATIESVLAQDYPCIEYIVINDGSSDYTEEVLRKYTDKIRWETQVNNGQAATLNKGWQMASGKYIGYISSDDILYPNAVTQLVVALEADEEIGVAYCDFDIISASGSMVKTLVTEEYSRDRLVVDLVCQPGVGALFRKELFNAVGGWSPLLRQVPDFEFWLRASEYGPFKRVGKTLGAYRVHNGSASFGAMSEDRANEIVDVMDHYWAESAEPKARQSKAVARLLAAKNHAQSNRPLIAFSCLKQALFLYPQFFFELEFWRVIVSGFFRGLYYRRF